MPYWEYCCLFENVISAPSYITIDGKLQKFDNEKYGFIQGILEDGLLIPSLKTIKRITWVHGKREVIGYSTTIITHNSGKKEKFYSLENIIEILQEFGDIGWELITTDTYYYAKDDKEYDIEKRHLLLNELGLLISEGFIEEIQLTRTKYLMKRTKEMSDFEMKALGNMKKSHWF